MKITGIEIDGVKYNTVNVENGSICCDSCDLYNFCQIHDFGKLCMSAVGHNINFKQIRK